MDKKHTGARISSQGAVDAIGNRYDLILVAARRTRELSRGDAPKITTKNSHSVTALMEIASGLVGRDYLLRATEVTPRRKSRY